MLKFFSTPLHSWALAGALIVSIFIWVLCLVAIGAMSSKGRKTVIAIITFIGGLYFALEFFWPTCGKPDGCGPIKTGENLFSSWLVPISDFARVMGGMTIAVGIWGLLRVHGRNLAKLRKGWPSSLALIISIAAITVIGMMQQYGSSKTTLAFANNAWDIMFNNMLISMDSSMFSLVAFYIVSASYRAFRIRSTEATILMITAFMVMLGAIPLGNMLTAWIPVDGPFAWMRVEVIKQWILQEVSAAALRGVGFGLSVGGLAIALRLWLSLERGAYYDAEV
ncbi:MAG: hypothetical protein ACYC1M_08845 [Armatimonadota bacterium]